VCKGGSEEVIVTTEPIDGEEGEEARSAVLEVTAVV